MRDSSSRRTNGIKAKGSGALRRLCSSRPSSTFLCNDSGSVAIEFAAVVPVLLVLTLGAIDFGSAFLEGQRLSAAAQAGTQMTLYDPLSWQDTYATSHAALEEYVGHTVDPANVAQLPITATAQNYCACVNDVPVACTTTCTGGSAPGQFVSVSVSGQVDTILSYPWLDSDEIALTRSSSVRVR